MLFTIPKKQPQNKNGNGKKQTVSSATITNSNGTSNGGKSPQTYRLVITLYETEDTQKDEELLRQIHDLLTMHRGKSEVFLNIVSADQITKLKFNLFVDISPDLEKKLTALIGRNSFSFELLEQGSLKVDNSDRLQQNASVNTK